MRVLVIGLGSIGKRHARLLQRELGHEVVALRTGLGQEQNDLGIAEISSWEEVEPGRFPVAVISNPTCLHIATATRCAERGMHLFIEKPIDCTTAGLPELLALVRERGLSSYVAYPLRFHPTVRELRRRLQGRTVLHASMVSSSFLPEWRHGQDHRRSYSRYAEQGGGVLLDMSHELDTAEYLFGPAEGMEGVLSRVSEVTVTAEDCADLLLRFWWGVCGVHLSMFGRHPRRWVEVDTADGYLRGDLRAGSVLEVVDGDGRLEELPVEPDGMYLDQFRYFFDHIGRDDMQNSLPRAARLFERIIEFREAQWAWDR